MRSWDILFNRLNKTLSFTRSDCNNEKVHLVPYEIPLEINITSKVSIEDHKDYEISYEDNNKNTIP